MMILNKCRNRKINYKRIKNENSHIDIKRNIYKRRVFYVSNKQKENKNNPSRNANSSIYIYIPNCTKKDERNNYK